MLILASDFRSYLLLMSISLFFGIIHDLHHREYERIVAVCDISKLSKRSERPEVRDAAGEAALRYVFHLS